MRDREHKSHGHKSGGKFTSSHTTYIEDATALVKYCEEDSAVRRVVLGRIESLRAKVKRCRVKLKRVDAGWEVSVLGFTAKQTIYIYTAQPQDVAESLRQFYEVVV